MSKSLEEINEKITTAKKHILATALNKTTVNVHGEPRTLFGLASFEDVNADWQEYITDNGEVDHDGLTELLTRVADELPDILVPPKR